MKRIAILTAAAVALFAWPVAAQVYVEGNVGASFVGDSDISSGNVDGSADLENTWVIGAAVGYRINKNFRTELNLSWRKADIDSVSSNGVTLEGAGDAGVLTGMVNGYYDFDIGSNFRPYVGAGLGFARAKIDTSSNSLIDIDDSDTTFAWNLMAGVSYSVAPKVDVTFGYRYLRTNDASFDASVPALGISGKMDADFETHEVLLGLRYTF